jgi:hypothetical protein
MASGGREATANITNSFCSAILPEFTSIVGRRDFPLNFCLGISFSDFRFSSVQR